MAFRILVTRPMPDADETAAALQRMGYAVLIDPVMQIERLAWTPPDWNQVCGLIITSGNAVESIATQENIKHIPIFAVGARTAARLQQKGFSNIMGLGEQSADLPGLIAERLQADGGRQEKCLLHLTAPHTQDGFYEMLYRIGFRVESRLGYRAVASKALKMETLTAWKNGALDAVLFYSPRSAVLFHALLHHHALPQRKMPFRAICLSKAVALSCEERWWEEVAVAASPTQAAMLDCLNRKVE